MKNIIFFLLLLMIAATAFSQEIDPGPVMTKQDYLQKSKTQKKVAWILVGTGTTAIITGVIIDNAHIRRKEQSLTGGVIEVSGIICGLTSIPFFVASGKNKRKSKSISFNFQKSQQIRDNTFTNISIPALTYKINF